jgi:hypothetical protein
LVGGMSLRAPLTGHTIIVKAARFMAVFRGAAHRQQEWT